MSVINPNKGFWCSILCNGGCAAVCATICVGTGGVGSVLGAGGGAAVQTALVYSY
jgi:hypothetical protein